MMPNDKIDRANNELPPVTIKPSPEAMVVGRERANPERAAFNLEVLSRAAEQISQPIQPTPAPQTPQLAPNDDSGTNDPVTVATSTPLVAKDEDLIEKEWVDRAKSIVADNKEDPYTQEEEISLLQADYLKKRYGRIVEVRKRK